MNNFANVLCKRVVCSYLSFSLQKSIMYIHYCCMYRYIIDVRQSGMLSAYKFSKIVFSYAKSRLNVWFTSKSSFNLTFNQSTVAVVVYTKVRP